MPTGSALFDSTNSQNSSESEEEEEKEKPLCRPESDEDLSVEYWHIQKLVDDLKVQKLSGFVFGCILGRPLRACILPIVRPFIIILDSFTPFSIQRLNKSSLIYTIL